MNALHEAGTPQPVLITVDQFELLDRSGAFDQFSKTELIEGVIYAMQGQHRTHAYAKSELAFRLHQQLLATESSLFPIIEGSVEISRPRPFTS
jgi:hypothetical protein